MKIRLLRTSRLSGNGNLDVNQQAGLSLEQSIGSRPSSGTNSNINLLWKKPSSFFESPRVSLRVKKGSFKNYKTPFRNQNKKENILAHEEIIQEQTCQNQSHQVKVESAVEPKKSSESIEAFPTANVSEMNPLEWISNEALPKDLLPRILSFAGPQAISSLSLISKSWRKMVLDESVWRVLCEETYKVRSYLFSRNLSLLYSIYVHTRHSLFHNFILYTVERG